MIEAQVVANRMEEMRCGFERRIAQLETEVTTLKAELAGIGRAVSSPLPSKEGQ